MSEHENCHVDPLEKPLDWSKLSSATAAYLSVGGMGCPRCAMRVRNGLLSLDDVLLADVFLEESMAVVAYNTERLSPEDLIMAVTDAGNDGRHNYQAALVTQVPAMQALA